MLLFDVTFTPKWCVTYTKLVFVVMVQFIMFSHLIHTCQDYIFYCLSPPPAAKSIFISPILLTYLKNMYNNVCQPFSDHAIKNQLIMGHPLPIYIWFFFPQLHVTLSITRFLLEYDTFCTILHNARSICIFQL